jgi:surfeit locus 1 family protein
VSARARLIRSAVAIAGLLALAGACGWLCAWQVRRANESSELSARFAAAAAAPALDSAPAALTDELRFRELEVRGQYAPEPQVLLDDRVHAGVAGYEVLTALELPDGRLLLVNRGWVAASPDRRVLPEVGIEARERAVRGRLERLPRAALKLGTPLTTQAARAPVVVAVYPTAAELRALLGGPVQDYEVLLDADADDGFARDWQAPVMSPDRHLAYAGQWFVFALGAVAAAVAVARSARASRPAEPAP